jgi:hypothetical protein
MYRRPDFVAEIVEGCHVCSPLTEFNFIRFEPGKAFSKAPWRRAPMSFSYVNTARGHCDRKKYQDVNSTLAVALHSARIAVAMHAPTAAAHTAG